MSKKTVYHEGEKVGEMWFINEPKHGLRSRRAFFKCKCGKIKNILIEHVKRRNTVSCGCIFKTINKKHGDCCNNIRSSENTTWKSMIQRCYNRNNKRYKEYGGRGITICDRWLEKENGFVNFLADMGRKPTPKHSLDRIDNNSNYCPENCRWATMKEQARNKHKNFYITYNGITKLGMEWSEEVNISIKTIRARMSYGWDIESVLFSPISHTKFKQRQIKPLSE